MTPARTALALELSCRYLQPLLDLTQPFDAELDALLAEWQVTRAQLRDLTNWTSLRFCEALCEWLAARIGAERLATDVARAAYSPRALGFLYPLLRAFGTPHAGYARLPQFVGVLNKVSVVRVLELGRGRAEIEYRPATSELLERSELICRLRKTQLAMGPTLWSLPAAYVDEVEVGRRVAGHVRVAFQVNDATAATDRLVAGGAALIAGPVETPWRSLNARLDGPAGLQLTLFEELDPVR